MGIRLEPEFLLEQERQKRDYEIRLQELREEVKRLETLEESYLDIRNEFIAHNDSMLERIQFLPQFLGDGRAVQGYYNHMIQFCHGSQFDHAVEDLNEGKQMIRKTIADKDEEIHTLEQKLYDVDREISRLQMLQEQDLVETYVTDREEEAIPKVDLLQNVRVPSSEDRKPDPRIDFLENKLF